MKVEVIRSARRRKTVQARIEGKVLKVMVPDNLSPQQEAHWVDVMRTKLERKGQPRPDPGSPSSSTRQDIRPPRTDVGGMVRSTESPVGLVHANHRTHSAFQQNGGLSSLGR